MKLIVVCVVYPPLKSSAAIQIKDLTLELIKQGHSVSLITPDNSVNKNVTIKLNKNLKIYRFKSGKLTDIPFVKRTINEFITPFRIIFVIISSSINLNKHDGIIWWSPSIFLTPLIFFLKIINNCPNYLIIRDLFPKWALDLNLIRNKYLYNFFNIFFLLQFIVADVVGIQSKGNKKFIPKNILFKKINIKLLRNWYSPISAKYKSKIDLKKTILKSKKVFVYAGNIGLAQNIENIIYLAEKLQNETDIGFLFVGRGSRYEFIRNLAKQKKIRNVLFYKQIPNNQLEDLYKQCLGGLVVLDKRHQTHNIPGKLLSYLFAGLPVFALVNKKHDLLNFINNNKIGFATDIFDIEYLANKIKEFKSLVSEDENINFRCQNLAHKNFNTSSIAKEITKNLTNIKNLKSS